MFYQLIASDLDGTLFNTAHQVTEKTKKVIQALKEKGITFIIATGRHFLDVNDIRQTLEMDIFLITANGARIHNPQGEMVYCQNIDPHVVSILLRPELRGKTVVNIYRDDGWFIDQPMPKLLTIHHSGFQYQLFDANTMSGLGVSKVFYIAEHPVLLDLQSRLEAELGDNTVATTFSSPQSLEVMHKGVSKGEALRQVAQLHGLSLADCLAFGDGLNDYELLSMAGKGLLMENAHAALKARLPCQEVIGHNGDDAVAQYLMAYYQLGFV